MEEQKRQMDREMNEMRKKMEKMTSPVATKPEVQMNTTSGTRRPEEHRRSGQSTSTRYLTFEHSVPWKVT